MDGTSQGQSSMSGFGTGELVTYDFGVGFLGESLRIYRMAYIYSTASICTVERCLLCS